MARRKVNRSAAVVVDDAALERRARTLVRSVTCRATDPPSTPPGADRVRRVDAETRGLPAAERVAAIEAVLDELGLLDAGLRRVRAGEAARERWAHDRGGAA